MQNATRAPTLDIAIDQTIGIGWDSPARPSCVLLTGGTGFIGSFLVEAFLRKGLRVVCIARPDSQTGQTPRERVLEKLRRINPDIDTNRLEVLGGDLCRPKAGLPARTIAALRGKIDEIWHCAADTSFDESRREQVFEVNTQGTARLLRLAADIEVPSFCLISTAYVSDPKLKIALEEPVLQRSTFRNAYEESKAEAENAVLSWTSESGSLSTIFRLPVVTGHSQTGVAFQFRGYYSFGKLFMALRERLLGPISESHQPHALASGGIRFMAGQLELPLVPAGYLQLPIRIYCEPEATINVLPVDLMVDTVLRCAAVPRSEAMILHITNGTPPKVGYMFRETSQCFGVTGIRPVNIDEKEEPIASRGDEIGDLERMIYSKSLPYIPYTCGEPSFSRANVERLIGAHPLPAFEVNPQYLSRILRYALEHNWGSES